MFFYSEPLIFIIQDSCFYKFTNSFYKATERQMAKTINVMQFCKDDIKLQNAE